MSWLSPAVFAIPGDITTLTGGYIYERRLLEGLQAQGRDVQHLQLPADFPNPTPAQMRQAITQLQAIPRDRALILDGLVFGAVDTVGLAGVRAPIVAMVHHPLALESGLSRAESERLFVTERDNLTLARHVLVPSPHTRAILMDRYGVASSRITVARPGVDPPECAPAPTDPPLILSVGIQHPRKGHDILISALGLIVDLDWRAVIVGSPWHAGHAADLARMVVGSGVKDRLQIAGRVSAETLSMLYAEASIFALATRYEGYGIVFDEALSYGLPIVSCATGAVPDIVPADAGLLVPPDDASGFAAALRELLSNRTERVARARAAQRAGAHLPGWPQTAHIAGAVLDGLAAD